MANSALMVWSLMRAWDLAGASLDERPHHPTRAEPDPPKGEEVLHKINPGVIYASLLVPRMSQG